MKAFAEVKRSTGEVLRRRMMPELDRDDGGDVVWLPTRTEDRPDHDASTHRLVRATTIGEGEVVDGWTVEAIPARAMTEAEALAAIDADAEACRLRYISPGDGQAMVYMRKEIQARGCLAGYSTENEPEAGAYPALDAEVGITGETVVGVAQVVVAMADLWASIADQIEVIRLEAKGAVRAAETDEARAQIAKGLAWPTPQ